MLRDRTAAEDCTQDTFERAYKAWKSWRPDAPAEAWLHRIAINTTLNGQRRGARPPRTPIKTTNRGGGGGGLGGGGGVPPRMGRRFDPADPAAVVERSD